MEDRMRRDDLTWEQRDYMRKEITAAASKYKYAVDKVHEGKCVYKNLSEKEKVDFELYYLLINQFPYEWID